MSMSDNSHYWVLGVEVLSDEGAGIILGKTAKCRVYSFTVNLYALTNRFWKDWVKGDPSFWSSVLWYLNQTYRQLSVAELKI